MENTIAQERLLSEFISLLNILSDKANFVHLDERFRCLVCVIQYGSKVDSKLFSESVRYIKYLCHKHQICIAVLSTGVFARSNTHPNCSSTVGYYCFRCDPSI